MTLEQAQPGLLDKLRSDRLLSTWQGWLDQQVRDAHVQYAADLRPADPSADGPTPPALAANVTPLPGAQGQGQGQHPPQEVTSAPGTALTLLLVGAAFLGVGLWGWRSLDDLVPASLPAYKQARKRRSLRRGAVMSIVGGGLLIVLALVGVVLELTS